MGGPPSGPNGPTGGLQRGPPPNCEQIQRMLDENIQLIQSINDYQSKEGLDEFVFFQKSTNHKLIFTMAAQKLAWGIFFLF